MKSILRVFCAALFGFCVTSGFTAAAAEAEPGFKSLFNGKDLSGWEGLPQFWSVKDGAITGQTTKDNPAKGNTFLVWKGGDVTDFELRLSYKLSADGGKGFANSGVQYRSKLADPKNFVVGGYQGDMEAGKSYSGILYEERGRGILAERGQKVVIKPGANDGNRAKIEVIGTLGSSDEIQKKIKPEGWNEYVIIAKGNHLQHFINGLQTVDVTDEQPGKAAKSGILALQLHAGDPMTAQFKDIRIKSLGQDSAESDLDQAQGNWVPSELIVNGDKVPAEELGSIQLKIQGNRFTLNTDSDTFEGRLRLNPATSPKAMDVSLDDGTDAAAIYEISDGQLKVCYASPDSPRPASFTSTTGSEHVLTIYKRKR